MQVTQIFRLNPTIWLERTGLFPFNRLRPLLRPILANRTVQAVLRDPLDELAQHGNRPLSSLAQKLKALRRRRRLRALESAGRPLVSVIVPAHNAANTVVGALKSLTGQSYGRLEIVVIDDKSTDETAALVSDLSVGDPRIRLLRAEHQLGAAGARNLGLAAARGDFVTFQDADDRSRQDRIERQLFLVVRNRRCLASLCAYVRVDPEGQPLFVNDQLYRKRTVSLLFRRDPVLQRLGGMAPLQRGEDSEYLARFTAAFGRSAQRFLPAPLYEARFSSDSLLWRDTEVQRQGNRIYYPAGETTQEALDRYRDWHRQIAAGKADAYLPLPKSPERDDPRGTA